MQCVFGLVMSGVPDVEPTRPFARTKILGLVERVYPTLKSEAVLENPYASAAEMRESIVMFRPASVRVRKCLFGKGCSKAPGYKPRPSRSS